MRKLSLLFFAFSMILLFSSCKKDGDSSGSGYYFKVKKDGNWISYADVAGEYGPDLGDPSYTGLVIHGQNEGASEVLNIVIQNEGSSIAPGSYASDNYSSTFYVVMNLMIMTGSSLHSYDIEHAPSMPDSRYVIKIDQVTEDAITGSFTGNYLYDDFASTNPETVAITEGEFRVKRIR